MCLLAIVPFPWETQKKKSFTDAYRQLLAILFPFSPLQIKTTIVLFTLFKKKNLSPPTFKYIVLYPFSLLSPFNFYVVIFKFFHNLSVLHLCHFYDNSQSSCESSPTRKSQAGPCVYLLQSNLVSPCIPIQYTSGNIRCLKEISCHWAIPPWTNLFKDYNIKRLRRLIWWIRS